MANNNAITTVPEGVLDSSDLSDKKKSEDEKDILTIEDLSDDVFESNPSNRPPTQLPSLRDDRVSDPTAYDFQLKPNADNREIRARNQSFLGMMGNSIVQTASTIALGTLEAVASLPKVFDSAESMASGTEMDFKRNWLENIAHQGQEYIREQFPIHLTNRAQSDDISRFIDPTFFASNIPQLANTLSLMIPALGIAGGTAKMMSLARIGKYGQRAGATLNASLSSRHMEGFMEGYESFDSMVQKRLSEGIPRAEAERDASIAATSVYKNNYSNLLMDLAQFGTVLRGVNYINKGMRGSITQLGKESTEGSLKKMAENLTLNPTVTVKDAVKKAAFDWKEFLFQGGTEAFEEFNQVMIGELAESNVDHLASGSPEDVRTLFEAYADGDWKELLKDPEAQNAAFLGALGGMLFQGVGNIVQNRHFRNQMANEVEYQDMLAQQAVKIKDRFGTIENHLKVGNQELANEEFNKMISDLVVTGFKGPDGDVKSSVQTSNLVNIREMFESIELMDEQTIEQLDLGENAKENAQKALRELDKIENIYNKHLNKSHGTPVDDMINLYLAEQEYINNVHEESENAVANKINSILTENEEVSALINNLEPEQQSFLNDFRKLTALRKLQKAFNNPKNLEKAIKHNFPRLKPLQRVRDRTNQRLEKEIGELSESLNQQKSEFTTEQGDRVNEAYKILKDQYELHDLEYLRAQREFGAIEGKDMMGEMLKSATHKDIAETMSRNKGLIAQQVTDFALKERLGDPNNVYDLEAIEKAPYEHASPEVRKSFEQRKNELEEINKRIAYTPSEEIKDVPDNIREQFINQVLPLTQQELDSFIENIDENTQLPDEYKKPLKEYLRNVYKAAQDAVVFQKAKTYVRQNRKDIIKKTNKEFIKQIEKQNNVQKAIEQINNENFNDEVKSQLRDYYKNFQESQRSVKEPEDIQKEKKVKKSKDLKEGKTPTPQSLEAKKADIERRKEEELDDLFKGNYGWSGWKNNKELLDSGNALVLSRQLPSSTEKAKYLIKQYKATNAKYNAELAAINNSTSNTSIGNRNDIERRRQEELDKVTTVFRIEREYINRRNNDKEYNNLTEKANNASTPLERIRILEDSEKVAKKIKKEVKKEITSSKKVLTEEAYNRINAKYDAELDALEKEVSPQEDTSIDEVTIGEVKDESEFHEIPYDEIRDLARRISEGEQIASAEDLQLQNNYPKELENELKELQEKEVSERKSRNAAAEIPKSGGSPRIYHNGKESLNYKLEDGEITIQPYQIVKDNPEIQFELLAHPKFKIGDKIEYGLVKNAYYERRKKKGEKPDKPIYIYRNDVPVGLVAKSDPNYKLIYESLLAGKNVTGTVANKIANNKNLNNINIEVDGQRVSYTRNPKLISKQFRQTKKGIRFADGEILLGSSTGIINPFAEEQTELPKVKLNTDYYKWLPEGVLGKINRDIAQTQLTTDRGRRDGHIWMVILDPNGNYVALNVVTKNLDSNAVDKVIEYLQKGEYKDAQEIVSMVSPEPNAIQGETHYDKYLEIKESELRFYSESKSQIVKVKLEHLNRERAPIEEAIGYKTGNNDFTSLDFTKDSGMTLEIEPELRALLKNKKLQVDRNQVGDDKEYISRLTGEKHKNYREYLFSENEVESDFEGSQAIVTTDLYSNKGSFYSDIGLEIEVAVDAKSKKEEVDQAVKTEVTPTKEEKKEMLETMDFIRSETETEPSDRFYDPVEEELRDLGFEIRDTSGRETLFQNYVKDKETGEIYFYEQTGSRAKGGGTPLLIDSEGRLIKYDKDVNNLQLSDEKIPIFNPKSIDKNKYSVRYYSSNRLYYMITDKKTGKEIRLSDKVKEIKEKYTKVEKPKRATRSRASAKQKAIEKAYNDNSIFAENDISLREFQESFNEYYRKSGVVGEYNSKLKDFVKSFKSEKIDC